VNQAVSIVTIALLSGVFAAGAFWVSVDICQVLGVRLAARRERKRLEAEAASLKANTSEEEAAD
jgi:hypothetical protein